jgi:hypothetical protein
MGMARLVQASDPQMVRAPGLTIEAGGAEAWPR